MSTRTDHNTPNIFDFHIIVNKLPTREHRDEEHFITVVADAPTERYGQEMGEFSLDRRDAGIWIPRQTRLRLTRNDENVLAVDSSSSPLTDWQIGEELFQLLFPPATGARQLLVRACDVIGGDNWLRIKLELHTHLSALPWELMRCPESDVVDAAVINGAQMAIVRYFGRVSGRRIDTRSDKHPTVILVCADPDGFSNNLIRDSFNREVAMIEEMSRFGFNLEVVRRHCGSPRDTYSQLVERVQRLVKESAHIVGVHFVGHGSIDSTGGAFVGETKDGEPVSLYAPQIQSALKPIHNLEWVLLNACWSGSAPESRSLAGLATALAVSQKVPTVLAYQMAVDTSDAEVLAAHFYKEGLVGGVSIEEVVWSVRMTCQNPNGLVVLQRSTDRRTPEPRTADGWAGRRYAAPAGFSPQSSPTPRSTQPTEDRAPATHDELILIPAGPFWKGLSREQIDSLLDQFKKAGLPVDMASVAAELSKQPRTQRDLPSFRIGRTPVTNAQFAQFVQATGYVTHAEQVGNSNTWRLAYDGPNKTNHPVILVSASDAEAYCHWANTRLPSLEEWEKAFRGPDGLAYPWGDEFDLAKCNSAETTISPNTTPVGMFATGASPYGCQDMLGNVEEWTSTTEGLRRCIVGGSWRMSCQVFGLPVLHRLAVPSSLFEDTGFRVAKDA